MNTSQKLQRNCVGDYIYKDEYIMRSHTKRLWFISIRGNNGHTRNISFKNLKQACAYIDNQQNESAKEIK